MSVDSYSIGLSQFRDFRLKFDRPAEAARIFRAWRNHHDTASECIVCLRSLDFTSVLKEKDGGDGNSSNDEISPFFLFNFTICCERFYFRPTSCYVPECFAVRTSGYEFLLPCLKRYLTKHRRESDQEFLVLPDPIFWHVLSTLVYDKTLRFASGVPMTRKTQKVLPASKSGVFYKQVQEAPLNHGSLSKRSGGKNTFFRQIAFGKRCELSARAMIVPDSDLRPDEMSLPRRVAEAFDLRGRWVLLNRMPTLQPDNFVALRVVKLWEHECFGIPLEILRQINGDFDGDECNLYVVASPAAQAECETLLNSERNAGSTTLGLKLHPCQDMLLAYHRLYRRRQQQQHERGENELDFFEPVPLDPSLEETMKTVYDLEGSRKTFECFTRMQRLYLREMQENWMFGLSAAEFDRLAETAEESGYDFEKFCESVDSMTDEETGSLLLQIRAGAKGSLYHAFQMFGSIGNGGGGGGREKVNSFWKGLSVEEAVPHALMAFLGFKMSNDIWKPGYVFYKNCFCLQGMTTNYEGNLTDGPRMIEKDALDAYHHSLLMSEKAFDGLLKKHFPSSSTHAANDYSGIEIESEQEMSSVILPSLK